MSVFHFVQNLNLFDSTLLSSAWKVVLIEGLLLVNYWHRGTDSVVFVKQTFSDICKKKLQCSYHELQYIKTSILHSDFFFNIKRTCLI